MANTFHDATICFEPIVGYAGTHEDVGAVELSRSASGLLVTELNAADKRSRKKDIEAENIVRGLVTEYLNCSTHISGIFCW